MCVWFNLFGLESIAIFYYGAYLYFLLHSTVNGLLERKIRVKPTDTRINFAKVFTLKKNRQTIDREA
jgi:hypothetical protein